MKLLVRNLAQPPATDIGTVHVNCEISIKQGQMERLSSCQNADERKRRLDRR